VVDTFEVHLTLDARSMICGLNPDLVIFEGMASELQILVNVLFKEVGVSIRSTTRFSEK
jgi:hypothetical protein